MSPNKTDSYQHRKHYKTSNKEGKHEKWKPSSHEQKKNSEEQFILERNKAGTPIVTSATIYEKWLHEYRIIVEKETPKMYCLSQGTALPPIQITVPPTAFDNLVANADYQADHKEARDKITKRENDLTVMRTNIVATTAPSWERF
jgi:hypothetical protein